MYSINTLKFILIINSVIIFFSCGDFNEKKSTQIEKKASMPLVEYEDYCRYCLFPEKIAVALKSPDSVLSIRMSNPNLSIIDSLFLFKNLNIIRINDCDVNTINYFFKKASNYNQIEELLIENSELFFIPDQIKNFSQLKKLTVIHDSLFIEHVSDSIKLLKNLRILTLDVKKFPSAISSLTQLASSL